MQLLTNEAGERAIQCNLFEETIRFTPNHLIVLTHEDGGVKWYVLGEAIQCDNDWIVPLQIEDEAGEAEARRVGYIALLPGGTGAWRYVAGRRRHGLATRPVPRTPLQPVLCRSDCDPSGLGSHGPSRDGCRGGSNHRRTSRTGR